MDILLAIVISAFLGWCGAYWQGRESERKRWVESVGPLVISWPTAQEYQLLEGGCPPGLQRVVIATTPDVIAAIRSKEFLAFLERGLTKKTT